MPDPDQMTDCAERFQQAIQAGGVKAGLSAMEEELRGQKLFHELFEVFKMRSRLALDLPLMPGEQEEPLSEEVRNKLDDSLLDNCREVGNLFLKNGQVQEGWMYLRPIGDTASAAEMIREIEVNEENVESIVGILLSEGVDPVRGFELLLEHYGTCNAITTFEGEVSRQSRNIQEIAAARLVEHLHAELKQNLLFDWEKRFGQPPLTSTFAEWLDEHPELIADRAYHIDTTHLTSVVRIAKLAQDRQVLERARELAAYGVRLDECYHYDGEEPFVEHYAAHEKFFGILLGDDVDASLGFFQERAEAVDPHTQGTMAAETYIDLLTRIGRYDAAIEFSIRFLSGRRTVGVALSLAELCQKSGSFKKLIDHCRGQKDVLGMGTGMLLQSAKR